MKKSTLIMILSLIMAVAVGMGSTVAFLQDTDADVNVMTLGKVTITQNEQEYNEDGNLVEFTQDKPLFPAVGTPAWNVTADSTEEEKAWRRFTGMENVVDKYVTVTNTGKSDAYVRTLIAFELGLDYYKADFDRLIGVSMNAANGNQFQFDGAWEFNSLGDVYWIAEDNMYGGQYYLIYEFVHQDPVAPGETTIPSLNQIYMASEATNEDIEKLDGNKNGKYDILVLSQAVQTQGFASAEEALNTAFGDPTANVNGDPDKKLNVEEWFDNIGEVVGTPGDKWPENNPPRLDEATIVSSSEEFMAALENGDELIYLNSRPGEPYRIDIGGDSPYSIKPGTTIVGMGDDVMIEGMLTGNLEDVSISNVTFSANSTMHYAYAKGNNVFNRCYFDSYGGGWAVQFDGMEGDVLFTNCTIKGRVATTSGSGRVTFRDCEFIGNELLGILRAYGNMTVENSTFDYSAVTKPLDGVPVGIEAVENGIIELINCTNLSGAIEDLIHESNGGTVTVK